jgi:hypothetical protein
MKITIETKYNPGDVVLVNKSKVVMWQNPKTETIEEFPDVVQLKILELATILYTPNNCVVLHNCEQLNGMTTYVAESDVLEVLE